MDQFRVAVTLAAEEGRRREPPAESPSPTDYRGRVVHAVWRCGRRR